MTQFGVRPQTSAARRRIDAAGAAYQESQAAKVIQPLKPVRTIKSTPCVATIPEQEPEKKERKLWFYPCFESGEADDIGEKPSSLSHLLRVVCQFYEVSGTDVKSARRHKHLVMPRHVFCYLAATATRKSLPQIGAFLGDRDHATVLHAVRKIKGLIKDGQLDPATLPKVI